MKYQFSHLMREILEGVFRLPVQEIPSFDALNSSMLVQASSINQEKDV